MPHPAESHTASPYASTTDIETQWLPSSREEAKATGAKFYFTRRSCIRCHIAPRYASNGVCVECHRADNRRFRRSPSGREYMEAYKARRPDSHAALAGKGNAEARYPGSVPADFDGDATISIYAEARGRTRDSGTPFEVDHAVPLSLGGQHRAENLRVVPASENRRKGYLERLLVAAATGADPVERTHVVWRDIRVELTELVGHDLAGRIQDAAVRLAHHTEAEFRTGGSA